MPLRCYKSRPTVHDKELEVFWRGGNQILDLTACRLLPVYISFRSADLASYRHRPLDRPFVI